MVRYENFGGGVAFSPLTSHLILRLSMAKYVLTTFDVAIIGGGPAGASAARLLAQWGHAVVLLTKEPPDRP